MLKLVLITTALIALIFAGLAIRLFFNKEVKLKDKCCTKHSHNPDHTHASEGCYCDATKNKNS